MEQKSKFNIDRMEITYKCTPELRKRLAEEKNGLACGENNDVVLSRDNNRTYHHNFSVFCSNMPVGELYFDSPNPNRPYVYLSVRNEILYTCVGGLSYIEQALGLKFYRISKLDVCIDTAKNIIGGFYKLLKDESKTIILNNKAIKDRKATINEILHVSIGSLDNTRKNKSFYIKGNEIELKAYDKRAEIMRSGKEYITENVQVGKRIYRMEISIPNHKEVKKALLMSEVDMTELYVSPSEKLIAMVFLRNLDRIIHLKGKESLLEYLLYN